MARRNRSRSNLSPKALLSAAEPLPLEPAAPMALRTRVLVAGAPLLGAVLWALCGNDLSAVRGAIVGVAVAVSLIPPVTRVLAAMLERVRRPSSRAIEWTGVLVGVVATIYLISTAFLQERPLAPRILDENSYAISAQLLAHGRLWMPQHPLADFFDSFFLVVRPKYSSIYFPGTGLAFAPAVWLGWPTWILPVVMAGVCVGLVYRLVTTLSGDGAMGLIAAVWMISLMPFRALSVMMMSQIVMLTLGLLLVWAWLRWREGLVGCASAHAVRASIAATGPTAACAEAHPTKWAVAIGAFAGWAAITRPVDAIAYALPVGVAMIAGLWGRALREWVKTGVAVLLAALPFLSLQVAHNVAITGDPFHTAYADYLGREQPGAQYGVRRYDPNWKPASSSPQMRAYYDWCRPFLEHHQPDNFLQPWFSSTKLGPRSVQPAHLLAAADNSLPARPLLLFLPAGLIALFADRRRIVLAITLPLFLLLYTLNPFFLPHYMVVVTPAMILLVLLGVSAIAHAAGTRWRTPIRVAAMSAVLALAITSLWEVRWLMNGERPPADGFGESAPQSMLEAKMAEKLQAPAVVLFANPPDPWTEAAYNIDVAWPDDAPIIRAHDLGLSRDVEIIDYYAQRQPDRRFYLYDWSTGRMKAIGKGMTAAELSRLLHGGLPGKTSQQP